jgi:tRNA(Arg) A34 adenosine deaminase TadA
MDTNATYDTAYDVQTDEHFMRLAMEQAHKASAIGEVPVGAIVVYDGNIIASGYNRREIDQDPSAHAEFAAMLAASRHLNSWRLIGCTVYVTLEPCVMCAGLMHLSRVKRCVYGAHDPKAGALGTLYNINSDERLNHTFEVTSGVLAQECSAMLSGFFASIRERQANNKNAADKRAGHV